MKRPQRNLRESLFNKKTFIFSLLQGLSVLAVVFAVYLLALHFKKDELEARTLSFATLVFANVTLIITNLSWSQGFFKIVKSRNQALGFVVAGALAALAAVIYVPFLRNLFHFSILHFDDIAITLFSGVISLLWFEGLKALSKQASLSS